ncbi:hypothetical protein GC173_07215 [bacterium]|nr:hypothetical protein [bacterium]
MRNLSALLLMLSVFLTTGCIQNALVMATDTQYGLDVSVADGNKQEVRIGYGRFEGVVFPVRNPNGTWQTEGFPTYAGVNVDSTFAGLAGARIRTAFSTGQASTNLLTNPALLKATGSVVDTARVAVSDAPPISPTATDAASRTNQTLSQIPDAQISAAAAALAARDSTFTGTTRDQIRRYIGDAYLFGATDADRVNNLAAINQTLTPFVP